MKKRLLIGIVLVSLYISLSVTTLASTPTDVRLTWSDDTTSTQTINWTSDLTTNIGQVKYKKYNWGTYTTVTAPAPEIYDGVKLWSVTLDNLYSGTTYKYKVGDGVNWTTEYTFKTASYGEDEFKFLVFGDTANDDLEYSGNSNMWAENLAGAISRNPDAKFLINVGDIVDKGQWYADWAAWLDAAGDVPAKIPFMQTVAKDECNYGEDYPLVPEETGPPILFPKMWKYPQNGSVNYIGEAYSFDYGNVHFVSLPNQNSGYYPGDPIAQEAMLVELAAWLNADLAATNKEWKIVVMHCPFYGTMSDRSSLWQRSLLQPVIDQHDVDLVLDGHNHSIARTYPMKNNKMYANPSEGTVYYTVGTGQEGAKDDVDKKIWHHFTYDGQLTANYLVVEIDEDELEIECYLEDGTLIDEYEIDKSDPDDCTVTIPPREVEDTHMVVFGSYVSWWNTYLEEESYGGFPFKDNDPEEEIPNLITNGEWCFDPGIIATMMNGLWFPNERKFVYDDMELEIYAPADTVSADGAYISEVGLAAMDFEIYYDQDLNLWFMERWRE